MAAGSRGRGAAPFWRGPRGERPRGRVGRRSPGGGGTKVACPADEGGGVRRPARPTLRPLPAPQGRGAARGCALAPSSPTWQAFAWSVIGPACGGGRGRGKADGQAFCKWGCVCPVGVLAPGTTEWGRHPCPVRVAVIWECGWPGQAFGDARMEGVHALHPSQLLGGASRLTWGSEDIWLKRNRRDCFRAHVSIPWVVRFLSGDSAQVGYQLIPGHGKTRGLRQGPGYLFPIRVLPGVVQGQILYTHRHGCARTPRAPWRKADVCTPDTCVRGEGHVLFI